MVIYQVPESDRDYAALLRRYQPRMAGYRSGLTEPRPRAGLS